MLTRVLDAIVCLSVDDVVSSSMLNVSVSFKLTLILDSVNELILRDSADFTLSRRLIYNST